MESSAELNRLRWLCTHRAMLEMDLLLGGFLDQQFSNLTPVQAAAFVALVEMEDLDLWALVNGRRQCADPEQASILVMLRSYRVKQ
jgi:antitoxin CptB